MHPESTGIFCGVCGTAQRQHRGAGLASPPAKVQINQSAFGAENNNEKGTNNSPERGRALLQVLFPRRSSPVPQPLHSGGKGNTDRNPSTFDPSWTGGKDTVRARGSGRGRREAAPPLAWQRPRLQPDGVAGAGGEGAVGAVRGCGRGERGGQRWGLGTGSGLPRPDRPSHYDAGALTSPVIAKFARK